MGYDMRWRKIDQSETEALEAAGEISRAALAVRDALPREEAGQLSRDRFTGDLDDPAAYEGRSERYARAQAAVMEAVRECEAAEQSYFRLNMWGMGAFADLMHEIGMTFNAGPHPEWPDPGSYGITWDDVERVSSPEFFEDEAPLPAKKREAAERFSAEHDAVLAWHGPEIPGIPEHKFGSNDGWIVLPAEAEAALRIYTAKLEEIGRDAMDNLIRNTVGERFGKWAQWLCYMRGAVTHDGFEVH